MSGLWLPPDDWAEPLYLPGNGSAHSINSDVPEIDVAEQVRLIAEEVTGKQMPRPVKHKMGFL